MYTLLVGLALGIFAALFAMTIRPVQLQPYQVLLGGVTSILFLVCLCPLVYFWIDTRLSHWRYKRIRAGEEAHRLQAAKVREIAVILQEMNKLGFLREGATIGPEQMLLIQNRVRPWIHASGFNRGWETVKQRYIIGTDAGNKFTLRRDFHPMDFDGVDTSDLEQQLAEGVTT